VHDNGNFGNPVVAGATAGGFNVNNGVQNSGRVWKNSFYTSEATKGGEKFKVNPLQLNNNIFYENIDKDVTFDFFCNIFTFAGPSSRAFRLTNLTQNPFFIRYETSKR
jgi:hypothetical protein